MVAPNGSAVRVAARHSARLARASAGKRRGAGVAGGGFVVAALSRRGVAPLGIHLSRGSHRRSDGDVGLRRDFPVAHGWLRDEIGDLTGLLETLGGVRIVTETHNPDADLGPVLAYTDRPCCSRR